MTNAGTPAPKGGMPKWLIILLVIVVIIGVGCCGGFVTCTYLFKKGAESASAKLDEVGKQLKAEMEKARAEEEKRLAEEAKTGGGTGTGDTASPSETPPTERSGTGSGSPSSETPIVTVRMPSNFPTDVPVYKGFKPNTLSSADKMKGSGMVMLTGKADRATVTAFYEKEMEKNGWKQESNSDMGEVTQMLYSKADRTVLVQVSPGDGTATNLLITYDKK